MIYHFSNELMGRRRKAVMPYKRQRKACYFCKEKIKEIDYKDVSLLSRYTTFDGRIESSGKTGLCAKHQRRLSRAIKKARHFALLPFVSR